MWQKSAWGFFNHWLPSVLSRLSNAYWHLLFRANDFVGEMVSGYPCCACHSGDVCLVSSELDSLHHEGGCRFPLIFWVSGVCSLQLIEWFGWCIPGYTGTGSGNFSFCHVDDVVFFTTNGDGNWKKRAGWGIALWQWCLICGDLSLTCALDLQHFYILLLAIVLVGLTSVIWACFSPGHWNQLITVCLL